MAKSGCEGLRATLSPRFCLRESAVKKGRHRRYEEARALKRGPDLDIDALFTDLGGEPLLPADEPEQVDASSDELDDDDESWEYPEEEDEDW